MRGDLVEDESRLYEQTVVAHEEFPGLYLGMALRVMALDNRLLFMGRIEGIQGNTIQISSDNGTKVPNIIYGTKIKLRGFYRNQSITLEGEISGSTAKFWWIENLRSLQGSEQREYFRQDAANMEATVMCANGVFGQSKGENSDNEGRPVHCKIVDISAGGTMIEAKADFKVGDWLLLVDVEMLPDSPPLTFTCIVRRVMQNEKNCKFGCEFYSLGGKEREQLIQAIFAFQRKELADNRNVAE